MAITSTVGAATGQQILSLASQHVGEAYLFGTLVPKDNPTWRGPWDCAEFASWLHYQVAGQLYGCNQDTGNPAIADAYTGFWDRDAKSRGHIVSIEQAARTEGAAIMRLPAPGAIGHIVISDGKGGTVEAHSHADGVIRSTIAGRRWDYGILVPFITYSNGSPVVVPELKGTIYRLTSPPMHGATVQQIQSLLKELGFDPGVIDGEFGPHTVSAVVAFQLSKDLTPDGEVGPKTAAALGIDLS